MLFVPHQPLHSNIGLNLPHLSLNFLLLITCTCTELLCEYKLHITAYLCINIS